MDISFREPSQQPPANNKEIYNDEQFLGLMYQYTLSNAEFGELFPGISHQAKRAHNGEAFQLYSKDTHREFHCVMVQFLRRFRDSLTELSKSFSDESTSLQAWRRSY